MHEKQEARKFAIRALVVSLSLAVVGLIASLAMELAYRQQDITFRLFQAIVSPEATPEIVILGDSRSALDIRQSMISNKVFNWAEVGEGLRQSLLKADFITRNKPSVKWIVLPMDSYVLSEYRAADLNFRFQMGYARASLLKRYFYASNTRILRNFIAFQLPILDHEQRLKFRATIFNDLEIWFGSPPTDTHVHLNNCLDLGFTNEIEWAETPLESRTRRTEARVAAQYPAELVVPDMVEITSKIIANAAEKGIQVIGLVHPVSNEYLAALKDADLREPKREIGKFALEQIVDHESIYATNQSVFNDMDHLRATGAQMFTATLVDDLQRASGVELHGTQCQDKATKTLWPFLRLILRGAPELFS